MAERTSTRNRRNTPQSPPRSHQTDNVPQQSPPRRTTRATRSQSRDVSDSETGNTGAKGGRRSARQANVQGPQAVKVEGNAQGRKDKANAEFNVAQGMRYDRRDSRVGSPLTYEVDPELSMVAEESNVGYPELAQDINTELETGENAVQGAGQPTKSPGNVSVFSGTTARASNPGQELKNSNAQDMLDTLPDLSDAADKVLHWLLPQNISEDTIATMRADLQYPGSRISKNVKRLSNVLQAQKGIYGDFENYINIPAVVKALLGSDEIANLDAGWRPEPLLHKANLTTLVMIITRSWGEKFNNDHFDFLESIFPAPFLSRSSTIEDLSIAVEIRTQHFIMLSSRYTDVPNFDPDMFLSQVFFNDPPVLKGWHALGLRAEDLTKEHQALVHRRLQDIRRNFSNGRAVDLPSLKVAYPWNAFVTKVIAWSRARLEQIQSQIETHGGVDGIVQALSNETQTQVSAGAANMVEDGTSPLVELDYPSPSEFSHTTSDRSDVNRLAAMRAAGTRTAKVKFDSPRAMLIGVERLRQLEAQNIHQQNLITQPVAPVAVMSSNLNQNGGIPANAIADTTEGFMSGGLDADDWQAPQIEDDTMTMDENTRSLAAAIVQHGLQREAAHNKENIADIANSHYESTAQRSSQRQALGPRKLQYIDRQPSAQRVEWAEPGFSQDVPSSSRGVKRNHAAADEDDVEPDPSQDEGFQQDNRNQDIAAKRRSKPAGARATARKTSQQQRAPKKARMTQVENQDGDNDVETAVNDYNNAGSPPESSLGVYQSSKSRALAVTASQPKKVQVRKAWTDEETGTLLDLIEEHGTSWRLLKEIDDNNQGILRGRDQVALKDKARNMKLDFLKAQADLPSNFEFVPLNKIQIQKLHDLGIEYNQDRGRRTA